MLNQFAVEIPTLPVDQCLSHLIRYLKGCWDILSYRGAAKKARQAFGTRMENRETFLQVHMHLHQLLILENWINGVHQLRSRFIRLQRRKVKDQNKIEIWDASLDRQPKIQSSSVEETLQSIMEQTNNDCRFLISTLTSSLHQQTFACWKIRFKTEVCTCSQFPTEAMQWTKEVELVGSVDELRSSSSIRGISMTNFEVLDARILQHWTKSSLIPISKEQSFWRNKRPRSRIVSFSADRLLTWSTITSGSLGAHDSVENYADLFTISLRNDDIQEFDSKWDGMLLSMTKIPHDDILEGLYKLRTRESQKLKTVLELYVLETHQKKSGSEYHRLKTMVNRRSEQEIRNNNFGIGNGNFEKNAVVKNQGTKQRLQRILGDCRQWETNGQCAPRHQ